MGTRRVLLVGWVILVAACSSNGTTTTTGSTTTAVSTTATTGTTTTSTAPTTSSTIDATTTSPTVPTSARTTVPATVQPSTTPSATAPTTTSPPTIAPTTPPTVAPSIPSGPSVAVARIPTDEKLVALTLDAGSDLGFTAQVLDVLAEFGVASSFGITGDFASAHPDHVRRMAREGHVVMNHSDSHASFTGVSSDEVLLDTAARQTDLLAADAILAPLIGRSTVPYWRPPFGDYDAGVLADVGAIGYRYTAMWTVDSLGWRGLAAGEITARVLERVEPGAIIVMHVGSRSADAEALPAVIDGLLAAGYRFTTVANAFP
jgi:peptidoglycan/xylan/chitin deacetylase (PgdA/CDA1 family)